MKTVIKRFPLDLYDTPGVRNISVTGVTAVPIGLDNSSGDIELLVEVSGECAKNAMKQELCVEIYGTGSLIPNIEDVTYVGSRGVCGFIWHIYYMNRASYTPSKETKKSMGAKYRNAKVIYKYEIKSDGVTELGILGNTVTPLWASLQYGTLQLWVLQDYIPKLPEMITRLEVTVTEGDAVDGASLINSVTFNDALLNVFYKLR